MKLLLDTHILLWAAQDSLPQAAQVFVNDRGNALLFSPVSLWEVVIKNGLGRSDFYVDPMTLRNGLIEAGYKELPVTGRHALLLASLPPIHKDPFDRMLLAQSISENVPLLTADSIVAQYPGAVIFVG